MHKEAYVWRERVNERSTDRECGSVSERWALGPFVSV